MAVVGSAEVLVRPVFSDLQKRIKQEVAGAGEAGGKQAGSGFGESLKKWGKRGAVIAGGAIAGGLAITLTKGLGRLTAIETAQAKMRGLGHDAASVDKIMANALASVKGTAFGLGEAATTAAGAVAAGIKPGEQLEDVLKSVANSAAAAGVGMDEMGGIYNKVASVGKAQNDSLRQVAERGIPIYEALAKQLGVTTEEVFDLASAGKINFEQFEQAMTSASGTVASEMGQTLTGSLANAWAAVGRLGATLLGGVFDKLAPAVRDVTGWIDKMSPVAERVGQAIGDAVTWAADQMSRLVRQFRDGEGAGGRIRDVLERVRDIAVSVATWVGENVVDGVKELVRQFRDGEGPAGKFRDYLEALASLAQDVAGWIGDNIVPAVKDFFQGMRDGEGPGGKFRDFLEDARDALGTLVEKAYELNTWIVENRPLLGAIAGGFLAIKVAAFGVAAAKTAAAVAAGIWTGAMRLLNAVLRANPIGIVITLLGALVGAFITAYHTNDDFRDKVDRAWQKVKDVVSSVVGWIKDTAWPWMRDAFDNMSARAGDVRDRVVRAWNGLKDGVSRGWDGIRGVFNRFKSGLDDLGNHFQSVRDGIARTWSSLGAAIARPINTVIDTVNKFLESLRTNLNKIPGVNLSGNWGSIPRVPIPAMQTSSASTAGRIGGGGAVALAHGGMVPGRSPHKRADNVPAWLTAGEYVLPVDAVKSLVAKFGPGVLERLRRGEGEGTGFAGGGGNGRGWLRRMGDWAGAIFDGGTRIVKELFDELIARAGFDDSWASQAAKGVIGTTASSFLEWAKENIFGGPGSVGAPVSGRISYGYGPRHLFAQPDFHAGIDYAVPTGTPVRAAGPGSAYTGYDRLGGNFVGINHPGALHTGYLHLSRILVRAGQQISKGQVIANSGNTGTMTTGPHLHFQVGKGSSFWNHVSPYQYLGRSLAGSPLAGGGAIKPLLFDAGGYLPPGLSVVRNDTGKPEPLKRMDAASGLEGLELRGRMELVNGQAWFVGQLESSPREVATAGARGAAALGSRLNSGGGL